MSVTKSNLYASLSGPFGLKYTLTHSHLKAERKTKQIKHNNFMFLLLNFITFMLFFFYEFVLGIKIIKKLIIKYYLLLGNK